MYINYNEISATKSRQLALYAAREAVKAVDPRTLMKRHVRYDPEFNSVVVNNNSFDLLTGRIFVVGAGKATGAMAEAFEEIAGPGNISAGSVCAQGSYKTKKIRIRPAGHPLTDEDAIKATQKILALKQEHGIGAKDLVVCLLSGGGSAMLACPAEGISLKDYQSASRLLINSGASIREINIVRKHLSMVKGGLLAQHFNPAKVASIIISDVIGNNLETIASGPTVPDLSTFLDAVSILEKYRLSGRMPEAVMGYLRAGAKNERPETAKHLDNASNYIIGDNATALETISFFAKKQDKKPIILDSSLSGETETAAQSLAKQIKEELSEDGHDVLIFGGETTPAVKNDQGRGGRNMHLAALLMLKLEDLGGKWTFLSLASDGIDHQAESAGAIIDEQTLPRARGQAIDVEKAILDFDSYRLFKEIGASIVKTGRTGTNVGDLMVFVRE